MVSDEDPMNIFVGKAVCPDCATISPVGDAKCPECDAFHIRIDDDDSRVNEIESAPAPVLIPEKASRDPGFYSVNPHENIPEEHFESDEDAVTDWKESSIDFALEDEE